MASTRSNLNSLGVNSRRRRPELAPDAESLRIPLQAMDLDGFTDWATSSNFPCCARISYIDKNIWITDWVMPSEIVIPTSARTLNGFRAWAKSVEFPRHGRISFIGKEIVVDMSPEKFEAHGKVKAEIAFVIMALNRELELGEFFPDRTLLTNEAAKLSTEPDGTFVLWDSLESGRARLVPACDDRDYIELQGTADWVLEVVSDSSEVADTMEMRSLYHRAGVPEYWLVDARGDEVLFQILNRRRAGYVAASRRGGWQKSKVFGRSFRLERHRGRMDLWRYTLEMKPD